MKRVKDVVIIDSGGANIGSVSYALERLGARLLVTADHATIRSAERLLLPGVGAAAPAMEKLRSHGLDELIPTLTQPVLGICLGMQLLGGRSEEGEQSCLGIVDQDATLIDHPRVPHMGWNRLTLTGNESALLEGLDGEYVYFVHSYAIPVFEGTTATTEYGVRFSAAMTVENFHAVQFHPERSSVAGSRVLENFLRDD